MSIEFSKTAQQRIAFSGVNVYNHAQKTISFWVYFDSVAKRAGTPAELPRLINLYDAAAPYTDNVYIVGMGWTNDGDLIYSGDGFSTDGTGNGVWRTTATVFAISNWYHVAITYDNSNTANDPLIYVNGVSKAITEVATPTGALQTGTNAEFSIGAVSIGTAGAGTSHDGKIQDIRIYDRILSSAEITTLSQTTNRCKYVIPNGLVFWMPTTYREGSASLDGITLASSDTIPDLIGNIQGVPYGSPIGRGVTDPIIAAGVDSLSFGEGSFQRLWFDDDGIHGTSPVTT